MAYKFKTDLIVLTKKCWEWMIKLVQAEDRIRYLFSKVLRVPEPKSQNHLLLSSMIVLHTDYLLLREFQWKITLTRFEDDEHYRAALLLVSALIRNFLQKLQIFFAVQSKLF